MSEPTYDELLGEVTALRARNQLLEEAARARHLGEVRGFLAHKLRTVLNCTLGYTSLLEDEAAGVLCEEHRHYLARISRPVDLMMTLVTELIEQEPALNRRAS